MKYISKILIILLVYSINVYSENNHTEYGFGSNLTYIKESKLNSNNGTIPEFIFNYDNYELLYSEQQELSARRVPNGYCLNIIPISMDSIPHEKMEPAGLFMITSDVYLEDAGFYKFSQNGLDFYNNKMGLNLSEDNRQVIITQGTSEYEITEKNIRQQYRLPFNNNYYMGIRKGNNTNDALHNGIYDELSYNRNLTIEKSPENNFSRPDTYSPTGYEDINYEIITYHTNLPKYIASNYVIGQMTTEQIQGNMYYNLDANLLGCYEVQFWNDGIIYRNANGKANKVEFVWLIQHHIKTPYPVLIYATNMSNFRKNTIFDNNFILENYGWHNVIAPYP